MRTLSVEEVGQWETVACLAGVVDVDLGFLVVVVVDMCLTTGTHILLFQMLCRTMHTFLSSAFMSRSRCRREKYNREVLLGNLLEADFVDLGFR